MVYIFKTNKIKLVSKDNLIFIVCISKYINLFKRINYKMANTHNSKLIFFQWNSIYRKQIVIDLKIKRLSTFSGHIIIWSSYFKALKQRREGAKS